MNPKINNWAQIRLVCPCHPEDSVSFELKKIGGLIYYCCTNPDCPNEFSSDVALKAIDKINAYWDKEKTLEGFSHYFRIKDSQMRMRYLKSIETMPGLKTAIIEVANLTKQPQYRLRGKDASIESISEL